MFQRVLIANRGEIALRILRACRELGVQTVAVYTKVDTDLLHLRFADEIVCISEKSYLDANSMVVAAKNHGCEAIHPGYGFLAENADFAELTEAAGLSFIGPDAGTISSMGDKSNARVTAMTFGLKLVPGSNGAVENLAEAIPIADEVGYPLVVKAARGGGGRGIRMIMKNSEFEKAFTDAQAESLALFSNGEMYIEKFLDPVRHIEVQVMGDGAGNAIHLGSRECSLQRKHQKIMEEAPAVNIPEDDLQTLLDLSVKMAEGLGYRNAGTLEFLYQEGEFYFIEMNTRLQVEHPVTECVTGIDLVKLQLEVASSGKLNLSQDEIAIEGHAIECRINAEDRHFNASPGLVYDLEMPGGPGVRVDSHLYRGYRIPHQYDSLIAKIITFDNTRHGTIARMKRALDEFMVKGIDNSTDIHKRILDHESFKNSVVDTRFLQREIV
ncbi:MAG: acetyl-CoA carboxylase biotin carboxylase subunit [Gammaproteobacteria bacterium]|nr:acetyl-CoA carboxylase biotin carboxylase subunit [Gammaproteobacteria bacterium]